jgi:predicted amidohydrolase YtcJ
MSMRSIRAFVLLATAVVLAGCCSNWSWDQVWDSECLPPKVFPLPTPPSDDELGADVVIVGRIRTLDPRHCEATGLVIRDGVIVHVTTQAIALRYASQRTRLITVPPDGVAIPGFIESHAHLRALGRSLRQIDLRGAKSADEAAALIAEAAKNAAPGSWILGRGWDQTRWNTPEWPNRMQLDQAAPGHPVALSRVDGHALWVSTPALEAAQISKASTDPAGGEILRDQAGEPTGVLIDNAMDAVEGLIAKSTTDDEAREDFLRAQKEAFRNGITTFVDAGETPEKLVLLGSLYDGGLMKLRVYAMVGCSTPSDLQAAFAREPVPSMFDDRLTVRAIKLYADGALGSRGAWLLEPYSDRPGHYGIPVTDPSVIRLAVRGCLDRRWQLCVHAIGDRANRVILDTIQSELDKTPMTGHRFRIEHAQCVDPSDLRKFRLNNVIPSIQPCHATSDAAMAFERLGTERLHRIGYPYKSMLDDWLHPCVGTDAPVESVSPVKNFYSAITRMDAEGRLGEPFMPEQRMNRLETLLGMTEYGAYAAFCEDRRGRLIPGYQADVVVLDHDLLGAHPDFIRHARALATIVAGEVVYEDEGGNEVQALPAGAVPGR